MGPRICPSLGLVSGSLHAAPSTKPSLCALAGAQSSLPPAPDRGQCPPGKFQPAPPPSLHPSIPGSSLCPPSHPARKRQLDNSQIICNPRTLTPQLAPSASSYQRKHAAWSVTASFSGPFPDTTQDPPGRGNTPPGSLPDAPAQPLSGWRLGAQPSSSGPARPPAPTCPGLRPFSCGQPSSAPTRAEPRYPQLWPGDLPPADCPASRSPSPTLRSLPKYHVRPVLVSGHLGEPRPSSCCSGQPF